MSAERPIDTMAASGGFTEVFPSLYTQANPSLLREKEQGRTKELTDKDFRDCGT